jgi:Tol biopolymer transport system component
MNTTRTSATVLAFAVATAAGFVTLAAGDFASASSPGLNGRIAFRSDRGGNFDIYTMNTDGSDIAQLAGSPVVDGQTAAARRRSMS